jgi:hypothetical protein
LRAERCAVCEIDQERGTRNEAKDNLQKLAADQRRGSQFRTESAHEGHRRQKRRSRDRVLTARSLMRAMWPSPARPASPTEPRKRSTEKIVPQPRVDCTLRRKQDTHLARCRCRRQPPHPDRASFRGRSSPADEHTAEYGYQLKRLVKVWWGDLCGGQWKEGLPEEREGCAWLRWRLQYTTNAHSSASKEGSRQGGSGEWTKMQGGQEQKLAHVPEALNCPVPLKAVLEGAPLESVWPGTPTPSRILQRYKTVSVIALHSTVDRCKGSLRPRPSESAMNPDGSRRQHAKEIKEVGTHRLLSYSSMWLATSLFTCIHKP